MTITLFIEPKSLISFIEVMKILKKIGLDDDYIFNPIDLVFSETMISNYISISIDIDEYLKLKYYIRKLSFNK